MSGFYSQIRKITVAQIKELRSALDDQYAKDGRPHDRETIDGIAVCSHMLVEFAENLRREMRGIKFGPAYNQWGQVSMQYDVLSVYYEEDEYVLGQIGIKYMQQRDKYVVNSRLINNDQYNNGNAMHRTRSGVDMKRMLREAKRTLRRVAPPEYAQLSIDAAGRLMQGYISKFQRDEVSAREAITGNQYGVRGDSPVMQELKYLVESGHEFAQPTLREKVVTWMDAYKQLDGINLQFPVKWVGIMQRYGRTIVNVLDANFSGGHITITNVDSLQTYDMEDVPDDVGGQVMTLSMLNNNDYVEGIGYKHNDNQYWIHV